MIGHARDCDVVIEDPDVADRHLRVSNRDGAIVVENLATTVDVDGTPVAAGGSLVVDEARPIRVGGTIVKLRLQATAVVTTQHGPVVRDPQQLVPNPTPADSRPSMTWNPPPQQMLGPPPNPPAPRPPSLPPRLHKLVLSSDAMEQRFLAALRANPGDAETRMVYADWLEANGLNAKAQLVRLREHLDTFMHRNATELDWRVVAVRTPIEHCIQNKCPQYWDALVPVAGGDFTRACRMCKRPVRYCGERAEVAVAGWENAPVVFDAGIDRVAAHATYRDPTAPIHDDLDDDPDDDPDGYTLDAPPTFRR